MFIHKAMSTLALTLGVFVTGAVWSGSAEAAVGVSPTCPAGWSVSGKNCTKPAACQSGYTETATGCTITITNSYPATCASASQRVVGTMCATYDMRTRTYTGPYSTPICDRGGTRNGGTCIVTTRTQTIGKSCSMGTPQGAMCVLPATCPAGRRMDATGKCV